MNVLLGRRLLQSVRHLAPRDRAGSPLGRARSGKGLNVANAPSILNLNILLGTIDVKQGSSGTGRRVQHLSIGEKVDAPPWTVRPASLTGLSSGNSVISSFIIFVIPDRARARGRDPQSPPDRQNRSARPAAPEPFIRRWQWLSIGPNGPNSLLFIACEAELGWARTQPARSPHWDHSGVLGASVRQSFASARPPCNR
jgi:hypothetical protein